MKTNHLFFVTSLLFALGMITVLAQTNQAPTLHPNGLSASYRMGFNISARFSRLGGFPAQTDPGPAAGSGINRTYDDGFNHVDSSGNAGGLTWNWGYASASQVPGDGTIVMHSSSVAPNAVSDGRRDDPQHGMEITYNRQLGKFGKLPWGFELALNYMDVCIHDGQTIGAPVTRITDAYALNGITPPLAPYTGSFSGPGPMLGDSPTRTTQVLPNGAMITGQRDLDANVFGWRLGPYLEMPLGNRCVVSLSGGMAAAWVQSRFQFSESVTIPQVGSVSQSGSAWHSDALWGGYVAGGFSFAVTQQLSLCAGVQFQDIGRFSQTTAGQNAELDFGQSIFLTAGLNWTF